MRYPSLALLLLTSLLLVASTVKSRRWKQDRRVASSRRHQLKLEQGRRGGGWTTYNGVDYDVGGRRRGERRRRKRTRTKKRPNIILVLTDDLDVELGSLTFMNRTRRVLGEDGATFDHAYVTTPVCCPSRSSLLTGRYIHNHNVFTNNDNCSSPTWQKEHEPYTFATSMSDAGYRTGYFGKYLNKYSGEHIPPGWREWASLIMNSRYYNYTINRNGRKIKYGFNYYRDYYPDLITNDSIAFMQHSKLQFPKKPFLMVLSYPSPHGPEDAAPEFQDKFSDVRIHHTASYDYAPNLHHQWILQRTGKMEPIHKKFTDVLMTKRIQTLQSVDIGVERVFRELRRLGEELNTYIFFTSDHGYHLGQFGLVKGKSFPFEFDIRVPFFVRGPGVVGNITIPEVVLNIDLAPTFLDIAGVHPPRKMDGMSLVPLLKHHSHQNRHRKKHQSQTDKPFKWRNTFLVESSGRRLRKEQRRELRRMLMEEINTEVIKKYEKQYPESHNLVNTENLLFDMNKEEKCSNGEIASPCREGQKWECYKVNGRWRVRKCRQYEGKCSCIGRRFRKLDPLERKMQRVFLKQHLNRSYKDFRESRNKFLKQPRVKRSTSDDYSLLEDLYLEGVAVEDEISDIDEKTYEISEEIADLREQKNTTSVEQITSKCTNLGNLGINCSADVYSDLSVWKNNKDFLDEQIRILKLQLDQLKKIRRHLKNKRPENWKIFDFFEEETALEIGDYTDHPIFPGTGVNVTTEVYPDISHVTEVDLLDEEYSLVNNSNTDENVSDSAPPRGVIVTRVIGPENQTQIVEAPFITVEVQPPDETCICDNGRDPRKKTKRKQLRQTLKEQLREAKQEFRRKLKQQRHEKMKKKKKHNRLDGKFCTEKSENLNCFDHNNDHWRTPPLWTDGPFCFCGQSTNSSYNCLRAVNKTDNFLYCEFLTGEVLYFDMFLDKYQMVNRFSELSAEQLHAMQAELEVLLKCEGKQCSLGEEKETGDENGDIIASSHKPYTTHHATARERKKKLRRKEKQQYARSNMAAYRPTYMRQYANKITRPKYNMMWLSKEKLRQQRKHDRQYMKWRRRQRQKKKKHRQQLNLKLLSN